MFASYASRHATCRQRHFNQHVPRTKYGAMTIYNNILETVGGTPVIKVNKLGPEGVHIYVKCEFFNPCGSVKDR